MNKIYLVNNKPSEPEFPAQFQEGCKKHDYDMTEISVENLSYYVKQSEPTVHIFEGTTEIITDANTKFYIRARKPFTSATALLSFVLEAKRVSFNERNESLGHNIRGSKLAQVFLLKQHSINFPSSLVTNVKNAIVNRGFIEEKMSYPMVIKQSGSKGEKVWKCINKTELSELFETLKEKEDKNILFQEYIENDHDIRVVVHYGKIITAIARYAADGFYNNLSQGGKAEIVELTKDERRIAIQAAAATDLELAGIDIVRTPNGPLLFEVNKSPDITAFSEAAKKQLPTIIAEQFLEETK
jgi:RimK family alpha-L-glutamate ligase